MAEETQNNIEEISTVEETNEKCSSTRKQEFISKVTAELGSSYFASLEAQNLWYYFEKCNSAKSDEEKRRARDRFFISLRQSLERMAIRRELRR